MVTLFLLFGLINLQYTQPIIMIKNITTPKMIPIIAPLLKPSSSLAGGTGVTPYGGIRILLENDDGLAVNVCPPIVIVKLFPVTRFCMA